MLEDARGVDAMARSLASEGVAFERDEPLARHTTIRLGGPAELFVRPASTDELVRVLQLAGTHDLPVRVLGAGSNLLVSDRGIQGVVVATGGLSEVRFHEGGVVEAGAGVHFPTLVRRCAARGLRGLEGGIGIPGSLGGVLTMNAGAYGFSIGPLVEQAEAVSSERGRLVLRRGDIDFRYRASSFGPGLIVASARLALAPDTPAAVRADMDRNMKFRKETQPVGVKSAGCIFKNPEGDSAGRIIDSLGLKGFRVGAARISELHANFIVHEGGTRTSEVMMLIERVREKVYRETRVELEPEVTTWS